MCTVTKAMPELKIADKDIIVYKWVFEYIEEIFKM